MLFLLLYMVISLCPSCFTSCSYCLQEITCRKSPVNSAVNHISTVWMKIILKLNYLHRYHVNLLMQVVNVLWSTKGKKFKVDSAAEESSPVLYLMVMLSDILLTAVLKSAFFTLGHRVNFRVCSVVRVRLDKILWFSHIHVHACRVHSHIHWTLISKLAVGVCVTAQLCVSQVIAWLQA